jgi:hypothetical protein
MAVAANISASRPIVSLADVLKRIGVSPFRQTSLGNARTLLRACMAVKKKSYAFSNDEMKEFLHHAGRATRDAHSPKIRANCASRNGRRGLPPRSTLQILPQAGYWHLPTRLPLGPIEFRWSVSRPCALIPLRKQHAFCA